MFCRSVSPFERLLHTTGGSMLIIIVIWLSFISHFSYGSGIVSDSKNVVVFYKWKKIDYLYADENARQEAIEKQTFIPQNVLINDVDEWHDFEAGRSTKHRRVFVTTPRFKAGVPAVVSEVSKLLDDKNESFKLAPFPNWSAQAITKDCSGIISVDKMRIDNCGLLWLVDSGKIDEFVNPKQICPPKLLIYDLKNSDQLIEKYEFPEGVLAGGGHGSTLTTIVTEARSDNCLDSIAYIADIRGPGLIVFDRLRRTSWRVNHNYFYPDPRFGTFKISDVTFDLMDGVFGMTLSPTLKSGDRLLYFHSLASVRESWVPTSALKNESLMRQPDASRAFFAISKEFRDGQSSLEAMTEDGILLYSVLPKNAIACWNTATEPIKENTHILYQNDEELQFISGMKLRGDTLWIASNRVQYEFVAAGNNSNSLEYRMRIVAVKSVRELLKNSACLLISSTTARAKRTRPSRHH